MFFANAVIHNLHLSPELETTIMWQPGLPICGRSQIVDAANSYQFI